MVEPKDWGQPLGADQSWPFMGPWGVQVWPPSPAHLVGAASSQHLPLKGLVFSEQFVGSDASGWSSCTEDKQCGCAGRATVCVGAVSSPSLGPGSSHGQVAGSWGTASKSWLPGRGSKPGGPHSQGDTKPTPVRTPALVLGLFLLDWGGLGSSPRRVAPAP